MRIRVNALCIVLVVGSLGCNRSRANFEGFTFSPDSTYLVAAYFRSGSSLIYKIPLDTGKAVRLTKTTQGFEGVPSVSTDGKRIVYSYSPPGEKHSHIIVASIDGAVLYSWPSAPTDDLNPLFAPDNRTIIFARFGYYGNYSPIAQPAPHEWNFYAADIDGKDVRQVTNENFYLVSRPSISPDGKTMLFVSSEESGDVIAIYSLEQPPKPKTIFRPGVSDNNGHSVVGNAMFMPDTNGILFLAATIGDSGYFDYDIYREDLNTRKIEKLTTANGYSYGLQISRDGKTAVFMRDISHWYGGKTEILLLDLATRKLRLLNVKGVG